MSYARDLADDPIEDRKYALYAMRCSLVVVSFLIILKLFAAFTSGSTAMLGSLIDTLGDGVLSLVGYISIKISLMPADEEHRHGHGKVEGFSALLQASFLMGSAVFLAFESLTRLAQPAVIENHTLSIIVSIIAIVATIGLVTVQNYVLKRTPSLAVEADQKHYIGDIVLNGGVIAALILNLYTGSGIVDTIIGLLIAAYIGYSGFEVGQKATDMLMDKEIGDEERSLIIQRIDEHENVLGIHDLRTRRAGMVVYISFDIELDPTLTLKDAHEITRELEYTLLEDFPHAEIIIHMDPHGDTYDTRHKVHGIHH